MNRLIKFRVWSKQYDTRKIIDWIAQNPCPPFIEGNFEKHEQWTKQKLAINQQSESFKMIYPTNFDCDGFTLGWTTNGYLDTGSCGERNNLELEPNQVLMQFTGLYDKNGKEIYEGDIIIETWKENNPYGYHPDDWSDEQTKYIVEYKAPKFIFKSPVHDEQRVIENWSREVIGNFFENPEFL